MYQQGDRKGIDSNKMGKGVAKGAQKKANPFKRSLPNRKEILLMTHDSVNERVRQLPVPSEQQLVRYVTEQSQALAPTGRQRGKPATLSALHLCLGIVLCGLQGFGSQLKLWRRLCLEVLALDESTLDAVGRWLPALRLLLPGDPGLLAGRISALFDLRRQQWVRVELWQEATANCKLQARLLLEGLQASTLLLFDRG